jgi:hypothetical protein
MVALPAARLCAVDLKCQEREMPAGFCADTWPSERTRTLHAAIKTDYANR